MSQLPDFLICASEKLSELPLGQVSHKVYFNRDHFSCAKLRVQGCRLSKKNASLTQTNESHTMFYNSIAVSSMHPCQTLCFRDPGCIGKLITASSPGSDEESVALSSCQVLDGEFSYLHVCEDVTL